MRATQLPSVGVHCMMAASASLPWLTSDYLGYYWNDCTIYHRASNYDNRYKLELSQANWDVLLL